MAGKPGHGGKPGRSGPPGNANARTRGGSEAAFKYGKVPSGSGHLRRAISALEKQIRADVVIVHGKVTTYSAALIQTACRHEARALLLGAMLRQADRDARAVVDAAGDSPTGERRPGRKPVVLTPAERIELLDRISAATDSRNKALAQLGLAGGGTASTDPLAALDDMPAPIEPDPNATLQEASYESTEPGDLDVGSDAPI